MNTMVGLETSLHTSVGEESCHDSMKDEKETAILSAAAAGPKTSGQEDGLLGSNNMDDDFDPIALLNSPLYDKFQESFANELSFGTFQDDSIPSSCRDHEEFSPRSSTQEYSMYNAIADHVMKTPMTSTSAAMASANSSPETIDSFANECSPEPLMDDHQQFLGPPVSQLTIPSGRIMDSSPNIPLDQRLNGYDNLSSNQELQSYMISEGTQISSSQQPYKQQSAYIQHEQQQYQPASLGMQTTQQVNDMQAVQLMQMQKQQQQQQFSGMQGHHQPTPYDTSMQQLQSSSMHGEQNHQHSYDLSMPQQHFSAGMQGHHQQGSYDQQSMQQQQQQYGSSPSLLPVDHQQQLFQPQQQMNQQPYASNSQSLVYNQALPGSVRISPSGRVYTGQSSASMSQLSQMRSVLAQNQPPRMPSMQDNSLPLSSQSFHGEPYGGVPKPAFRSHSAVNQSLSQSLHDPSTQRRGASFQAGSNIQSGLVMPMTTASAGPGGASINEAMSQLCDSMRRSAMSRNFVKQLSNRSLSTGQSSARGALGRTNSMHSQNSSRSLMNDESSGRPVPVRRTSSAAKYHLQHPMRGIHRHDSQQSLSRSNHSCKSFD